MSPVPPPLSASSSSVGQSPETNFRVIRKRNRVPLSCGPCRHRKLKCNRQHPCDNCTKRADTDSCTYAAPNARKKSFAAGLHGAKLSPDEMQGRIDRLEGLVLSLMTNGPPSAGQAVADMDTSGYPSAGPSRYGKGSISSSTSFTIPEGVEVGMDGDESEVEQVTKSVGVMRVDNGKAFFIDENHWYSILAGISEVKNYFSEHKKQFEDQMHKFVNKTDEGRLGLGYLFAVNKPADKAEILARFPTKAQCDILITRFFQNFNMDVTFQIIHGPTYQNQYDAHWRNPNPESTSVVWLGTTLAMMIIALQSYQRAGDEPIEYRGQVTQMLSDFRRLTVQCIIFNDLSVPDVGTVELLLLLMQSEAARSPDSQTGVMLLANMAARLAMRSGYHRDAKDYSALTPFQGEMRRRSWVVLRTADLLYSTQFGLTPMIRPSDWNTELPRNLYDDELSEEMKELPPSRPLTEPTPTCYCIYKGKLMSIFGEIIEEVQTLRAASYERVLLLDQQLTDLKAEIPPIFKMRPIEESLRDPPPLVMQRIILDLAWQRARIVLHRKFTCPSRSSHHVLSRRSAFESALDVLEHQVTIHKEMQPGGRLGAVKTMSSLMSQDFLLAAMVVTVDVYQQYCTDLSGQRQPENAEGWFLENRRKHMVAIERSLNVWTDNRECGMEAFKAYTTLSTMLRLIRSQEAKLGEQIAEGNITQPNFTAPRYSTTSPDDPKLAPEHSAAMTLGMLSTGAMTPNTANMFAAEANNLASTSASNTNAPVASMSDLPPGAPGYFGTSMAVANPNAPSVFPNTPFNNMFAGAPLAFPFSGEQSGSAFDWDALDSFMANPADPSNTANTWGMNVDSSFLGNVDSTNNASNSEGNQANSSNSGQQQQQGQNQSNAVWGSNMFLDPGIRG